MTYDANGAQTSVVVICWSDHRHDHVQHDCDRRGLQVGSAMKLRAFVKTNLVLVIGLTLPVVDLVF